MKYALILLLLVSVTGCCAGMAPDRPIDKPYPGASPSAAFRFLISALNNADFGSAYQALSESTQCRYSTDEFANFFVYDDFGREFRRLLVESRPVTIAYRTGGNAAVITVLLDGRLKSFNFVKEDNGWKFDFDLQELFR